MSESARAKHACVFLLALAPLAGGGGACGQGQADQPADNDVPSTHKQQTQTTTQPHQTPGGQTPDPAFAAAERKLSTLLRKVVTADGLVRYDLIAQAANRRLLGGVVAYYTNAKLPLNTPQKVAFLCNAYNVNVLALAVKNNPNQGLKSVRDVAGFFDELTVVVAGQSMTLNDLENKHVRTLGDPRVHAALVCAALSCPPLRREPYHADQLDEQLDDQCRRWINDLSKNRADDSTLWLSTILDWYKDDFNVEPYGGRVGFVQTFADPKGPIHSYVQAAAVPRIRWMTYDWRLNRAPTNERPPS